ncbi:MAG: CoA-binding protein [Candidatus Promineifilaceae bacterium]|nr:CoA-binding protein [Candidatus Promineifilaceae bacterium]
MNETDSIKEILATTETIAVVGFSSRRSRAGYYVPAYLKEHGYRIIPVNPHLDEGLGVEAHDSLATIDEPVDLVLVFRRPEHVPAIVDEAIAIEAAAVWMQLGIRHQQAAEKARQAGLTVVQDACMMVEHRRWR